VQVDGGRGWVERGWPAIELGGVLAVDNSINGGQM